MGKVSSFFIDQVDQRVLCHVGPGSYIDEHSLGKNAPILIDDSCHLAVTHKVTYWTVTETYTDYSCGAHLEGWRHYFRTGEVVTFIIELLGGSYVIQEAVHLDTGAA